MNPQSSSLTARAQRNLRRRARRALRRPRETHQPRRLRAAKGLPRRHSYTLITNPWWRRIAAVLIFLACFLSVFSYVLMADLNRRVEERHIDVSQFEDKPRELVDDYSGRAVNILLIGSDTRSGAGNDDYGDPDVDWGMRSDATIVLHISADRKRVQLVSIPRDMMVDIPSCRLSDRTRSDATFGQFNSAFSIGSMPDMNLAAGVACTRQTVEDLTGLHIDEFVVIDFAGFQSLVDSLGGVDMCFDEDLYSEEADLNLTAGCHHLDGTTALSLARARYNIGDGTDLGRIGRQQQLMMAIIKEALGKSMLSDLPTLYSFLSAGIDSVHTSKSLTNLNTSAGLLQSIRAVPTEEYQFVTMPWQWWALDPNRVVAGDNADEVWQALVNDQPFPAGTKAQADGVDGVIGEDGLVHDPSEVSPSPSGDPNQGESDSDSDGTNHEGGY